MVEVSDNQVFPHSKSHVTDQLLPNDSCQDKRVCYSSMTFCFYNTTPAWNLSEVWLPLGVVGQGYRMKQPL